MIMGSSKLNSKVFWGKNRLRPRAIKVYQDAIDNEKKSSDELLSINWQKRKELVNFAFNSSPFYFNFYSEAGFYPTDLKHPEDWNNLPVLEKKHVQHSSELLISGDSKPQDLLKTTTGGSTGVPLRTYRDHRFPEEVIKWRMLRRWNSCPSDNILMLWRVPNVNSGRFNRLYNRALWFPTERYKFDVSALTPALLSEIEAILVSKRPPIIWGYVGALVELANHLEAEKISLDYEPLLWATASPTSRSQYSKFNKVFGPKILDQYACSEVHWVAANVPGSRDLVVETDFRHIDIVDGNTSQTLASGIGDILLTDLENRAFPLIRYRNGDRSSFSSNDCFDRYQNFPRIHPVMGRRSQTLRSMTGTTVPGEYVTTIFDDHFEYIDQFEVHQKVDFTVDVKVVPSQKGRDLPMEFDKTLEETVDKLHRTLGGNTKVTPIVTSTIPHQRGKLGFIKSDLDENSE